MSTGRYLLGVAALFCILGSLGLGAVRLRAFLLPTWRGACARLAELVIGVALLVLMMELLGTVSLFRLVPLVVASVLIGLGLRFGLPASRQAPEPRASGRPGRRLDAGGVLMTGLSLAAALAVLGEWLGPTLSAFDNGVLGQDSIWYHMPHAASFAITGNVSSVRFTDVDYLNGFYPATAELFHALGIVLMGNDVLSPGLNMVWLALALFAAWCLGAPRRLGPTTLLAGAIVLALPTLVNTNAGSADTDVSGLFFVISAMALWLNAVTPATAAAPPRGTESPGAAEPVGTPPALGGVRGGSLPALFLAGVAAGLAISVKLNLGGPALALTIGVILTTQRGIRLRAAGLWFGGAVVGGGYWLLRNLIAVGNPLPWFSFGVLPTPQPPPLQQHTNYSIVNYATYPRILSDWFAPALAKGLGPWWVIILVLAVVGPLVCIVLGGNRLIRITGAVALLAVIAYPLTPLSACGPWGKPIGFHDNLRYGASALTMALAVTPLALPLARRYVRELVFGGFVAVLVATIAQQRLWNSRYVLTGPGRAAALVLVVTAIVLLRPWSWLRARPLLLRALAGAGAATLVGAGVAVAYTGQRDYVHDRYSDRTGLYGIHQLWHWADHLRHARIALAGSFGWYFSYPVYGDLVSNHVVFMGQRGPHGSFTAFRSCQAWRRAVNTGHFRYVVATAKRTMWTRALSYSPEADWTRSDPAAKPVFRHQSNVAPVQVFKLSGPMDPAGCAHLGGVTRRPAHARSRHR